MKIAVVTGANGGIASKIVQSLREAGVLCVTIDMQKQNVPDYYQCDFSNPEEVVKTAQKIKSKYEKIDYLFNVAGVGIYKKIKDLTLKEWVDSFAINLHAPFILTKYLISNFQKSLNPVVINVGSGMGVIPSGGRTAYCSSKFALRGLSLSLSEEFKKSKIKFVLLTLGSVMTNFGTGGIVKRKELEKKGKKYLTVDNVVSKIMDILQSENIKEEYKIYPNGYSKQ